MVTVPGSNPVDWPIPERPRDLIDVDERTEQALRETVNAQHGVERKALNQEQGPGDYIAG